MKVVKSNEKKFKIYGEELVVMNELPVGIYSVQASQFEGPYLERTKDVEVKEEKIYGNYKDKADKIIKTFKRSDRSVGVILSGEKGLGKSLTAGIIAERCIEDLKIPVIIVTQPYGFLDDFINSIEQEVMVLFDEFEKKFDDEAQQNLLTFFDGNAVTQQKRIYVITCNNFKNLNEYFINRPGRFHYHFRFTTPNLDEITEYLNDNLDEQYKDYINEISMFGISTGINFDCLRAIVSEVNAGYPFKEAVSDLNIMKFDMPEYTLNATFESGVQLSDVINVDPFADSKVRIAMYHTEETKHLIPENLINERVILMFRSSDVVIDPKSSKVILAADKVIVDRDSSLRLADCTEPEEIKEFDDTYGKIIKVEIERYVQKPRYDFW